MDESKAFLKLKKIYSNLASDCSALRFELPVKTVYNPLVYASRPHGMYLKLAGAAPKKIIFLGMNPGPWGMAQTGVPFGEISAVRDWLGIEAAVSKPDIEHPKRPIEGFACTRSEVSGRRLWGLFRDHFNTPQEFFRNNFIANYCPLVFMDINGANITPDKLHRNEKEKLFEICDRALADIIKFFEPEWLIGIGAFAKKRIDNVSAQYFNDAEKFSSLQILHPSPASPKANSGWEKEVLETLAKSGIALK